VLNVELKPVFLITCLFLLASLEISEDEREEIFLSSVVLTGFFGTMGVLDFAELAELAEPGGVNLLAIIGE
jgi:hypothetical protein